MLSSQSTPLAILLTITFFSIILVSGMTEAREFKIIGTPEAPYKFESNDANPMGIVVDIVSEVMNELNIKHSIVLVESGARVIKEAKVGHADMVMLFSKKTERLSYLIYPEQSVLDISWRFFIRESDKEKIKFNTLEDLKSLKIGATKDYSYTKAFWRAGLDLDIVSINGLQIDKLLLKRIDAAILNTDATLFQLKREGLLHKVSYLPKPLVSRPYYNAFSKQSDYPNLAEVIRRYDEAIARMKSEGRIQEIIDRYTK